MDLVPPQAVPLASKAPDRFPWSWAIVLTAVGLFGAEVYVFGGFMAPYLGGQRKIGWDAPGAGIVLLFLAGAVLLSLCAVWAFAGAGALLFWRGSRWGAVFLVAVNLIVIGLYESSQAVYSGQLAWGVLAVLLAVTPLVAVGAILRALLSSRGPRWLLVIQLLTLAVLAAPALWLYANAMAENVSAGLQQPPTRLTASQSCAGALPVAAITIPSR